MSTKKYVMPKTTEIGAVQPDGRVRLSEGMRGYLGGLEDVSGRVANYVSGTPTATQIRDALVAAGLMKSS